MSALPTDFGARIVEATRMAVTAHWQLTLSDLANELHQGQPDAVEGIDGSQVTDDRLLQANAGGAGSQPSRRPSRLARFKRIFRRSRR